jgi:arginyl-tRNA synthetase
VIRAVDLINDVKDIVKGKMKDADETAIQQVAVGAIKFSILKSGTNKDIKFDFDTSLSFEGDSGPYLQYTYARCKSVLAKAHPHREDANVQMPKDWELTSIEKLLYRLPEIVERAAVEYEPHYIANYLNDLASAYNSWYGQGKILDGSDNEHYKLALTEATAHAIKNGLYLLGIETPERM